MAKLTRKTLTQFGRDGGTSNFGQFGSQAASAPVETKDVASIQSLSAWVNGWQSAVAVGQAPYLQDMNGLLYVYGYELCYMLQAGVPEYDGSTTYYIGSVVQYSGNSGYVEFYTSRTDTNSGNALPTRTTNSNWQFLYAVHLGSGLIIPGTTTNDDAPSGMYGEVMRAQVSDMSFTSSGAFIDVLTLSLTPGDWDLSGVCTFEQNSATVPDGLTSLYLSAYSGTTVTDQTPGDNYVNGYWHSGYGNQVSLSLPNWRVSISAGATYYLKASLTYNAGTPKISARFSARRAR